MQDLPLQDLTLTDQTAGPDIAWLDTAIHVFLTAEKKNDIAC